MRIIYVLTFIIFLIYGPVTAQKPVCIYLKIIDKVTKEPVQGVSIEVLKDKVLYRTLSDSVGNFLLPILYLNKEHIITAEAVDYFKLSTEGASFRSLKVIALKPSVNLLKEVVIKGNGRYRDTTEINLSGQHFDRSVMIDDLFNNTYGLFKDSKGQLYYNGKRVTDILIGGRDFFGKNNLDVYRDMPALTLENIIITETTIDSLSNATLAQPQVKLNLKLKEKFKRGRFGNLSIGVGSLNRYFLNTDTYFYNSNEQFSLGIGANNISPYSLAEPDVNFSPNGNDLTTYTPKISYHNFINSNLELDILVTGKKQNKNYQSQSERNEENLNMFSSTKNISGSDMYSLEPSNVILTYKIDRLSKIVLSEIFSLKNELKIDSLQYIISNNNLNTNASLTKVRESKRYSLSSTLLFERRFQKERGRYFQVSFNHSIEPNKVGENNSILNIDNQNVKRYDVTGDRRLVNKKITLSGVYNEPILSNGTSQVIVNYSRENLGYQPRVYSINSLSLIDTSILISYSNYQFGGKIRKNTRYFSFDGSILGALFVRNIRKQRNTFIKLLPNINLSINHKIDKKNELNLQYEMAPNYPKSYQLTNINNTFDLVSLAHGNIYLNPELKSQLSATYSKRSSDLDNLSLSGRFEHYESKFGYKIDNVGDSNQVSYIDNMSRANAGQMTLSTSTRLKSGNNLIYSANIQYSETPINNRNGNYIGKSIIYSQTGSLGIELFNKRISITPTVNTTFNRQYFESTISNIFMLSYSDNIIYSLGAFKISAYPLCNLNYSSNLNKSLSWAVNGDVKLDIFNKNATLWMKAYDIFNSFKYENNYAGLNYIQTIKYSNLNRYILIGISTKVNNMK